MNRIPSPTRKLGLGILAAAGILALAPVRAATTIEFATNRLEVVEGGELAIPLAVSPSPRASEIRYRIQVVGGTTTRNDFSLWPEGSISEVEDTPFPHYPLFAAVDDGRPEADETLELRLEAVLGAEVGLQRNLTVTLHNLGPQLWLNGRGDEMDGVTFFPVRRGDTNVPVTVAWSTTNEGTAVPGVDFSPTNGLVTIVAGDRSGDPISIPWIDNGTVSVPPSLVVRLSDPSPGASLGQDTATFLVDDNEVPATPDFRAAAKMSGPLPLDSPYLPTAALPDGGMLRLRNYYDGATNEDVLFRYDPSGNLVGLVKPPDAVTSISSLLAADDGKVFVSCNLESSGDRPKRGLVRLQANGQLDKTFAPLMDDAFGPPPHALLRQPGGRLIVAVWTQGLLRLLNDGTKDPTFAATPPGLVPYQPGKAWGHIEGAFLVQGTTRLLRFHQDGVLDASFQAPEGSGCCRPVTVLPDGRILLMVYDRMVRLKPDGSMDTEFHSFHATDGPSDLLPDGRFLAGLPSSGRKGSENTIFLGMVLPDGRPDPGLPGILGYAEGDFWRPSLSLHLFANGKALVWGEWYRFLQVPKTAVAVMKYPAEMRFWRPEVFVLGNNNEVTTWDFWIRRFGETTGPARVRVRTRGGTLQAGLDYEPLDQVIAFAPLELERSFTLNFMARLPSARSRTVTIELLEAEGFEEVAPPVTVVLQGAEPAFVEPGVEFLPGGWTGLVLDTPASQFVHRFEVSDDFQTWLPLRLTGRREDGRWEALDPNAANASRRFYRASVIAP